MLFRVGEVSALAGSVGFWLLAQAAPDPSGGNNYGAYGVVSSVTAAALVGIDWFLKRRKAIAQGRDQQAFYDALLARMKADHAEHVRELAARFREEVAEYRRLLTNARKEVRSLEDEVTGLAAELASARRGHAHDDP